jgi:hypothetical protein
MATISVVASGMPARAGRHRPHQTGRARQRGRAGLAASAASPARAADRAEWCRADTDALWDDRAETDAERLVGLLFLATEP